MRTHDKTGAGSTLRLLIQGEFRTKKREMFPLFFMTFENCIFKPTHVMYREHLLLRPFHTADFSFILLRCGLNASHQDTRALHITRKAAP